MGWLRDLVFRLSSSRGDQPGRAPRDDGSAGPDVQDDGELPADLVVELPITEALDLHLFRPSETADVLRDYLDAAIERGFCEVRIIHGRGIGTQRTIVRKVLSRDPRVRAFADAPADRGGWGATVAELCPGPRP